MTTVFAVATTLIAIGVGFGIPVFFTDLREDLRNGDYKFVLFDIFVMVVLTMTLITLLRDIIWRTQ